MKKQKLPPFVPMFVYVMDSPAWLAMSPGARAFFLAFKKRYSRKTQQAVFLSVRVAAKELGADKGTVSRWCRELQHFGFIVEVRGASFDGGSIPAHRRTVQGQASELGLHLLGRYFVLRSPVRKTRTETRFPVRKIRTLPYAKCVRKTRKRPKFPYAKCVHI